jgi:hypothetical protein
LGIYRWVVERTLAWLHHFRRLRIRYEQRADIHEAFLSIGCSLICFRRLFSFCLGVLILQPHILGQEVQSALVMTALGPGLMPSAPAGPGQSEIHLSLGHPDQQVQ